MLTHQTLIHPIPPFLPPACLVKERKRRKYNQAITILVETKEEKKEGRKEGRKKECKEGRKEGRQAKGGNECDKSFPPRDCNYKKK